MLHRSAIFAFTILLSAASTSIPAHSATLYVASSGSNDQTCSAAGPCTFLNIAVLKANPGDSIVCLSPPQPAGIFIDKSITIDCSGIRAEVRDNATTPKGQSLADGVYINIPVSAGDPNRTVRLRGLTIDGNLATNNPHYFDRGIDILSAAAVFIEDTVVSNVNQQGIIDRRTGGQSKLFIKDTVISGAGGAGLVTIAPANSITVLDNVSSQNNAYGIAVGTGNNVEITRSVFSGNSSAGIEGDAGSHIMVSNSAINHNNIGVQSNSSVRIFMNDISFNNAAFSGSAATAGLNRYYANGSMGTTPSSVTGAPSDIGP